MNRLLPACLLALALVPPVAHADPLAPARDRPGALLAYQGLMVDDRRATLEAFTGLKFDSDTKFETVDACALREATEDTASRARLSATLSGCLAEAGLKAEAPAPQQEATSRPKKKH